MRIKHFLLSVLFIASTSHATSFIGTYRCTGHDPYLNRDYSGTVIIKQQNTVYSITMKYDTGERYKATGGQYNDELMSVVFQDTKNLRVVGLEQYRYSSDYKRMGGYWVYLGHDKLGKETCIKQESA